MNESKLTKPEPQGVRITQEAFDQLLKEVTANENEPDPVYYAVEKPPNREYFTIHLSIKVPEIRWIMLSDRKMTPEAERFKEALMEVPGIVEVTSSDYVIRFKRGGVFLIDDLVKKILPVLESELGIHGRLNSTRAFV